MWCLFLKWKSIYSWFDQLQKRDSSRSLQVTNDYLRRMEHLLKGTGKTTCIFLDINVIYNQEFNFVAQSQKEDSLQVWHERMRHQSKIHVKELLMLKLKSRHQIKRNFAINVLLKNFNIQTSRDTKKATKVGELVVTDVYGKTGVDTDFLWHLRMILYNIEKFTLFVTKVKLHHVLNNILNMFILRFENVIKTIMSDKGTKYTDQTFVEIAKKNGIEIRRSAIYTPQQNGRAEREN